MSHTVLLEIGTEEMPARFVRGAAEQLEEKTTEWLEENRISFSDIRKFATPRRFAVLITGVDEKQADINEEAKGPSKKIAVDEDGNWTKAAQGFARGQGVDVSELYVKEFKGEDYVFARKHQEGAPTRQLLPGLKDVIMNLTFPKNMRWGSHALRYVRPIRWMAALCDSEVIPFEITGVKSSNVTEGHRFLGQSVAIERPETYATLLEQQYVIADLEERKKRIRQQIERLAGERGWNVPIDEGLLEEVTNLVEYPTVFFGTFAEEFLQIPREVLVTSMREHQRYFPVENGEGKLLPYFVAVRNGDDTGIETVAKGNEKVLRARLADARFFYQEDQKVSVEDYVSRLDHIVYHEELGSIGDKVRRVREIAGELSEMLKLDSKDVEKIDRTAEICKFDLVTNMVDEFSELQGVMGREYAKLADEDEAVANGIFEHYMPRFSGDRTPDSIIGAIVGVSDKIDTIVGSFSIGLIPTGSQDPYGLRRQASGIVQILLKQEWEIPLSELFDLVLTVHKNQNLLKRKREDIAADLHDFFDLRMKNRLQEDGVRYDVIDAVLGLRGMDLPGIAARAQAIVSALEQEAFKQAVESFNRVHNLAAKAEGQVVDPGLFEEKAEQELYDCYIGVRGTASLEALQKLKQPIDRFFDEVMVMTDQPEVRNNRLALLKSVDTAIRSYADFSKLVL